MSFAAEEARAASVLEPARTGRDASSCRGFVRWGARKMMRDGCDGCGSSNQRVGGTARVTSGIQISRVPVDASNGSGSSRGDQVICRAASMRARIAVGRVDRPRESRRSDRESRDCNKAELAHGFPLEFGTSVSVGDREFRDHQTPCQRGTTARGSSLMQRVHRDMSDPHLVTVPPSARPARGCGDLKSLEVRLGSCGQQVMFRPDRLAGEDE
jgi:hypothetical protein